MGHVETIQGRRKFIIFIMMDNITVDDLPEEMKDFVRAYTYIGVQDMEVFRQKLKHAMPKKALQDIPQQREAEMNLLDVNIEQGENDARI